MGMSSKSNWLAWVVAMGLAPAGAAAQQMSAAQVLARVSQAYQNLKTYEVQATDTYSASSGQSFAQSQTRLLLAVDAGGKLRLEREDAQNKLQVVSDGNTTWTYAPLLHQYTIQKVAANLGDGNDEGNSDDAVTVTESLLVGRYRGIEKFGATATLDRDDKVKSDGRKIDCYVVEMRIENARLKLWVDQERFLVLRQDQASPSGVSAKLEIRQFATAGPLDADLFSFTPSTRSREVEVLHVPGVPASLVGKPAQNFKLKDLDGNEVTLGDLQGKVVLLDFWATWCPPCREELPVIAKLYAAYRNKDVVVLGVNDEDRGAVKRYLDKQGLTLPVLADSSEKVHALYGCHAIPTVIVINRQGTVTAQYVGGRSEEDLRAALHAAGAAGD